MTGCLLQPGVASKLYKASGGFFKRVVLASAARFRFSLARLDVAPQLFDRITRAASAIGSPLASVVIEFLWTVRQSLALRFVALIHAHLTMLPCEAGSRPTPYLSSEKPGAFNSRSFCNAC
jgi:hypothetical protein